MVRLKKIPVMLFMAGLATVFSGPTLSQTSPKQPPTGMTVEEYENTIMGLPVFDEVIDNWKNKAKPGNVATAYKPVRVLKTWPAGKQVVFPKQGDMIIYQLTGMSYDNPFNRPRTERMTSKSIRVVAIDAKTKKVLAWKELPLELKGNPHSSPVTADGRYIYASGPPLTNFEEVEQDDSAGEGMSCTNSSVCTPIPTTMVKIDTLTLEAVKVITSPGRQHHGHVFRDKYLLFDTFTRDRDGVDTYLFDPETDQVIAGLRSEEMGGTLYTAWLDPGHEHIYQLMEPGGYAVHGGIDGYLAAHWFRENDMTAIKPFWIAKIKVSEDLKTWEVVREYPYFGGRANWVQISPDNTSMYITPAVRNIVSKINLETGQKIWTTPVGDGPYGVELTADGSELWVANKGETTGFWGNDITIIDARSGIRKGLINTGFSTDHIILSPDGTEMWTSSNAGGKLYVYDAKTREQKAEIAMPGYGDPHGLPFVYYDEDGKGRLVADQNGFHNGVNAQMGNRLDY